MVGTMTLLKAQMGALDPTILGLLAGGLLTLGGCSGQGSAGWPSTVTSTPTSPNFTESRLPKRLNFEP